MREDLSHYLPPHPVQLNHTKLLDPVEVTEILGISIRKLWRMVRDGDLPAPLHIGKRRTRWRDTDIIRFMNNL